VTRPVSDVVLLFAARGARLFAYGFLSVILALYLEAAGLSAGAIGVVLTLALAGDAVVSLLITTSADRIGRRRMLIAGAALMAVGGVAFASTGDALWLAVVATIGVFSPSGHEVGPFLSLEQASLSQLVRPDRRTHVFARYVLVGAFATAAGALGGGVTADALQRRGMDALGSYRVLLWAYAAFGVVLMALFARLSRGIEPARSPARAGSRFGLHRSRSAVLRLSALFALDSFGGGFVIQSLMALWFHRRFGFDLASLGTLFFAANLVAGVSALFAARIAARIGLVNTMVVTHLPSNVLLCAVPLMPSAGLAVGVLLARFCISQMDVPTRQSYTMAIVDPDERSAAAGITGIARSVGASLSPAMSGVLMGTPALAGVPFFIAGGLKIAYDLLVYRGFRSVKPPEE
jgi:predicted MFS family arabinose efflux permease